MPDTLRILALYCRGGIPLPSLQHPGSQVRDEQIRRDDGACFPFLARCHDLATRRNSPGSSTPAEPKAVTGLPAGTAKVITVSYLKRHTIPAGGGCRAGIPAGIPTLLEPAIRNPSHRQIPDRLPIRLARAYDARINVRPAYKDVSRAHVGVCGGVRI